MLINYNGKYDDVSTLAHELGHTMQSYLLEQDAAVSAGRLPDFRRRGRVHVQRVAAHRLHARRASRTTTRGCRCSATISRTSRARCSARRSSPSSSCGCTRWPAKGEPITGDALAKLYLDITQQVLRPRPGRLPRRRLHRARVELHPALLPRLLRVPVRDVVHGVEALAAEGEGRRSRRASDATWRFSAPADRSIRSIC